MSILKLLVGGHVFGVGDFAIKRHYGAESVAFRYKAQLTRSKVVVFTMAVHFLLRYCLKVVFLQIFNRQLHH